MSEKAVNKKKRRKKITIESELKVKHKHGTVTRIQIQEKFSIQWKSKEEPLTSNKDYEYE